jgi:hypothetical protein
MENHLSDKRALDAKSPKSETALLVKLDELLINTLLGFQKELPESWRQDEKVRTFMRTVPEAISSVTF